MKLEKGKGFTLIELLVVIAIISLLSSVVMASLSSARMKGRDSKRIQELKNVSLALNLYFDKYGRYPPSPNYFPYNHLADFNAVVGALVTEGFMPSIPVGPSSGDYNAYDYGAGSAPGLIIVTTLEAISPTTIPPLGSCRPFPGLPPNDNWCSSSVPQTSYCLCHPY